LDSKTSAVDNYLFLKRLETLDRLIANEFMHGGIPADLANSICIDSGTTRIIVAFIMATAQRGEIFLTPQGYYHPMAAWCALTGTRLVCVPTSRQRSFRLTRDDLEAWKAGHRS